jgi:hypothetical protein
MVFDRLLAAVEAPKLDRELADGAREDATQALARRARKLTAPATREQLARQLRLIVNEAHDWSLPGPRVPPYRRQVLAAEDDLRLLASRLQSPSAVSARGVARVRLLLTDGCGPMFSSGDLSSAARDATAALG